jgi:membrane protein
VQPTPAADEQPKDLSPDPEGKRAVRKPAWQLKLDRTIGRITANPIISQGLAVMDAANEAAAPLFAAALAFATLFAVIPLILLLAGLIGFFVQDPIQRNALLDSLVNLVPPLAELFETTLDNLAAASGTLSIIGLIGLLWGSSSFYAALDEVMRRIFPGGTIRDPVVRRIRGVLVILIVIGLVVGSYLLTAIWDLLDPDVADYGIWRSMGPVIGIGATMLVVWGCYLFIPTKPPSWRAAFWPAVVAGLGIGLLTSLFGLLTPILVGSLAGLGVIASVFGALIWLNFSYQILFYGAAWARVRRDREEASAMIVTA